MRRRVGHTFHREGAVSLEGGRVTVRLRIMSGGRVRVSLETPCGVTVDFERGEEPPDPPEFPVEGQPQNVVAG